MRLHQQSERERINFTQWLIDAWAWEHQPLQIRKHSEWNPPSLSPADVENCGKSISLEALFPMFYIFISVFFPFPCLRFLPWIISLYALQLMLMANKTRTTIACIFCHTLWCGRQESIQPCNLHRMRWQANFSCATLPGWHWRSLCHKRQLLKLNPGKSAVAKKATTKTGNCSREIYFIRIKRVRTH